MARKKTEAAESKVNTASALAGLGGAIGSVFTPAGGAIGAGIGGVTGLIIGDDTTVFPIDMVAIPAFQAYLISGNPTFSVYINWFCLYSCWWCNWETIKDCTIFHCRS